VWTFTWESRRSFDSMSRRSTDIQPRGSTPWGSTKLEEILVLDFFVLGGFSMSEEESESSESESESSEEEESLSSCCRWSLGGTIA